MARSRRPRAPDSEARAEPRRLVLLIAATVVVVGGVVAAIVLVPGPRPDAILTPTGGQPDDELITLLASEGQEHPVELANPPGFGSEMQIDLSTLRAFGTYEDFELWSAVNAFDSACLIAVHRQTSDVVDRECVPAGAELFIDTAWHGLGAGERLRFRMRGDSVDAFLLKPEVD